MHTPHILTLLGLSFAAVAPLNAQNIAMGSPKGAIVYATYAAKPIYPYIARARHIGGSGVFTVHITADGKVSSVGTLQSTGNRDLDDSAVTAFRKWRFRPPGQPTKVEMPITFSMTQGPEDSHPLHPTRSE